MATSTARGVFWQAIRLPVFALLAVLEPVLRFALCGLAILSVIFAFFFEFVSGVPDFPFWGMLGFGVACALAMMLYYALMRIFSR